MSEIDFAAASEDPENLSLEPVDLPRRPKAPDPTREIPNQLLSARRAFELRDDFVSGERDLTSQVNDEAFELTGRLARTPTEEEIDVEVDLSNTTRSDLGLDLEDEALFRRFRSPQVARTLATQYLIAMGLEQVFTEQVEEF